MKRICSMARLALCALPLLLWSVHAQAQQLDSITLPEVQLQVVEKACPADSPYTQMPNASFAFQLEGEGTAPMPAGAVGNTYRTTVTAPSNATRSILLRKSMGAIVNAPIGKHTYTLRQVYPATDPQGERFAYDESEYTIHLYVDWKDGVFGGELVHVITISQNGVKLDGPTLPFVNQSILVDPPIEKLVEGTAPPGDLFTLEMKADNPAYPMPEGASGGVLRMSTGEGSVEFGFMNFTTPGTYTYTLREVEGTHTYYNYDDNQYKMKVVVGEENGSLTETHTLTRVGGGNTLLPKVAFRNLFMGSGEHPLPDPIPVDFPGISKALSGGTPATRSQFVFDIVGKNLSYPSKACPMPQNAAGNKASLVITGTGTVQPGKVTFAESGEYEYTVTERKGTVAGYTYSQQTYRVHMVVQENPTGGLEMLVNTIYADGSKTDSIVFTNAYAATSGGGTGGSTGGSGSTNGTGGSGSDGKGTASGTPKTGDDTNRSLLWLLLALSAVGMALCALVPGKKRGRGL